MSTPLATTTTPPAWQPSVPFPFSLFFFSSFFNDYSRAATAYINPHPFIPSTRSPDAHNDYPAPPQSTVSHPSLPQLARDSNQISQFDQYHHVGDYRDYSRCCGYIYRVTRSRGRRSPRKCHQWRLNWRKAEKLLRKAVSGGKAVGIRGRQLRTDSTYYTYTDMPQVYVGNLAFNVSKRIGRLLTAGDRGAGPRALHQCRRDVSVDKPSSLFGKPGKTAH